MRIIKKNRLPAYEELLLLAKNEGYIMMGINEFLHYVKATSNVGDGKKYL